MEEEFYTWDDDEEVDFNEEPIQYHAEDIDFELHQTGQVSDWLTAVVAQEQGQLLMLNFIFCSDAYLHNINLEYLKHDDYTDVITFPYADPPQIHGDIFISIERVRENAHQFGTAFIDELHRIMVHGVLHLCGYGDKTPEDKARMTEKENEALALMPKA